MGQTQENWGTQANDWSPPFKYHLQLKATKDLGSREVGVDVWNFKGEADNSHGDGKVNIL